MIKFVFIRGMLAAMLVFVSTLTAQAAESDTNNSWQFEGTAYLWGAGISGKSAAGDDIDISFNDLVDNLQMGFMGGLQARKDKWGLFGDFIYLDVDADDETTANLIGQPIKVDVGVELKAWIVTAGGMYQIKETDTTRLELLGGLRYLWMKADLDFDLGPITEAYSDSGDNWDGIIGLKGVTQLNEKWYLTYYGDIGAGDSELTWQALLGLNYRFSKVDAAFGYRYLKWDFDDNDTFDDLDISGPYAGVRFRF